MLTLTYQKFDDTMKRLGFAKDHSFAVAVSGGADSMALALLLKEWCDANSSSLIALSVDHGLRKEAKDETQKVKNWLSRFDIQTEILTLKDIETKSGLQENARQARYDILSEFCAEKKIETLFIGHHAKDQIETVLQRLVSGSGLDGLRGMDEVTMISETLSLVRPFLGFEKQELLDFLKENKQEWIEDPSNQNEDFTRIRLRKLATELQEEGLDAKRIQKLSHRLNRSIEALDFYVEDAFSKFVMCYETGYLDIQRQEFSNLPEEIQLRLLIKVMHLVSGREDDYLRLKKLETLHEGIISSLSDKRTLMGCVFDFTSKDTIRLFAEVSKDPVLKNGIWDDRFIIEGQGNLKIRPFQESDVAFFKENAKAAIWNAIPTAIRMTLPVFCKENGEIMGNPLLGYGSEEFTIKHRFTCFYAQKS